jgi:hypothetical protein
MIHTNAHSANGKAVVRGPSLRERPIRRLGESPALIPAEELAGVAGAAQPTEEVSAPEPRRRDPGATPSRWVRLS